MSSQPVRSIAAAAITAVTTAIGRTVVGRTTVGRVAEETRRVAAHRTKADHQDAAEDHGNGQQDVFEELHARHSMIGSGKKS